VRNALGHPTALGCNQRRSRDEAAAGALHCSGVDPRRRRLTVPTTRAQEPQLGGARDTSSAATATGRSPDTDDADRRVGPIIVEITRPRGFDWGSAAIGVAAGIALAVISLAGAAALVPQLRTRAR